MDSRREAIRDYFKELEDYKLKEEKVYVIWNSNHVAWHHHWTVLPLVLVSPHGSIDKDRDNDLSMTAFKKRLALSTSFLSLTPLPPSSAWTHRTPGPVSNAALNQRMRDISHLGNNLRTWLPFLNIHLLWMLWTLTRSPKFSIPNLCIRLCPQAYSGPLWITTSIFGIWIASRTCLSIGM